MSRIGKRSLIIPENVEVKIATNFRLVEITGPLGSLKYKFAGLIAIKIADQKITTTPLKTTRLAKMMHGTVNALLNNALNGVVKGFEKILLIEGLGYKFTIKNPQTLVLDIGYSHPVELKVPENIKLELPKPNRLKIFGFDKQAIGLFASIVRKLRPCEPYKGKGIHYLDEKIKRKVGKTSSK